MFQLAAAMFQSRRCLNEFLMWFSPAPRRHSDSTVPPFGGWRSPPSRVGASLAWPWADGFEAAAAAAAAAPGPRRWSWQRAALGGGGGQEAPLPALRARRRPPV